MTWQLQKAYTYTQACTALTGDVISGIGGSVEDVLATCASASTECVQLTFAALQYMYKNGLVRCVLCAMCVVLCAVCVVLCAVCCVCHAVCCVCCAVCVVLCAVCVVLCAVCCVLCAV